MSTLDSLALTRIPPADEALRAEVRAFLLDAIQDLPAHVRARSWGAMPEPVSQTSMRTHSPACRQPSTTPPRGV